MLSPENAESHESDNYEHIIVHQVAHETDCDDPMAATTGIGSKTCILRGDFDEKTIGPLEFELSTNGNGFAKKCQKNSNNVDSFGRTELTKSKLEYDSKDGKSNTTEEKPELLYSIDDVPPWHLGLCLGFQQYMLMFSSTMVVPFILSGALCFSDKPVVISNVLNTIVFVSGIVTFIQATVGCRLPIIQGTSFAFIAPTLSIMSAKGACPTDVPMGAANSSHNISAMATSDHDEEWVSRMLEIQGAIIIAALVQMMFGFTGVVGHLLKFVGPLTVVPTIVLVGLPLFETAYKYSSVHWGIAMFTFISVIIFSQVLREVKTPIPYYNGKRWQLYWLPSFKLFPVMLSIIISWILCAILTYSDVFPSGHKARTDHRISVLQQVPWIRVPYPGQWGIPIIKLSTVIGMVAGVLTSMLESVGDYYACATISGAPPPPKHAINRGLGLEGFGCLLTGVWGTGCGTTSYSNNVASLGITRVGSRRVIQFGALFMSLVGIIGKFGALFITIPDPVIGGNFIALFGLLIGVGMGPLQFIDLNSMRNLFVLGNALFFGMVLPFWVKWIPNAIQTGSVQLDQVITVLLSTPMAIGGMTGFLLDNLLPGTLEERGLKRWRMKTTTNADAQSNLTVHTYDIPVITPYLQKFKVVKYLPFLPYYGEAYFKSQC